MYAKTKKPSDHCVEVDDDKKGAREASRVSIISMNFRVDVDEKER